MAVSIGALRSALTHTNAMNTYDPRRVNNMNAIKRAAQVVLAAGMVVLGLGVMEKAHAFNPDTMTVSVSPTVTYGVAITSVISNGYQFQSVALGATTVSTSAITLTNSGNVSEYFSMAISNSTGSWTATAGAAGQDTFRMIAELSATQPAVAGFAVGDALTNTPVPAAAANLYNNGGAQTNTPPAGNSKLRLRLDIPTSLDRKGVVSGKRADRG